MENKTRQSGFTLIEVIIYLALLAMMFSGAVACVYGVVETSEANSVRAAAQEEGDFLLAKIDWAMTGAVLATVNDSSASLAVSRSGDPASVFFDASGDYLEIKINGGAPEPLNGSGTRVRNLVFADFGHDTAAESVTASFTLLAKTPGGRDYSQDFQLTSYLKK